MNALPTVISPPAPARGVRAGQQPDPLRHVKNHGLEPEKLERNIEKFIGAAQVPIGLAGPMKVRGDHANGIFRVPFATTEGTLVSGYTMGMLAASRSGGIRCKVISQRTDVTPVFEFGNLDECARFAAWLPDQLGRLRAECATRSTHSKLTGVKPVIVGRRVFVHFDFDTRDAMGMNAISFATDACCEWIHREFPGIRRWYLRSNLSADKKPAFSNFLRGYGKEVCAEVTILRSVATRMLGVTPEEMAAFWHSSVLSGFQAGTVGHNAHYANALAAIFIACGQDVAQIVNASQGISTCEVDADGNAYFAVRLPCMIVATVGGGTHLPTQRECLELMDCYGDDRSDKFAELVAATLLAGEISILSGLANGSFIQAHARKRDFAAYHEEKVEQGGADDGSSARSGGCGHSLAGCGECPGCRKHQTANSRQFSNPALADEPAGTPE